jgi:hypothetical protein
MNPGNACAGRRGILAGQASEPSTLRATDFDKTYRLKTAWCRNSADFGFCDSAKGVSFLLHLANGPPRLRAAFAFLRDSQACRAPAAGMSVGWRRRKWTGPNTRRVASRASQPGRLLFLRAAFFSGGRFLRHDDCVGLSRAMFDRGAVDSARSYDWPAVRLAAAPLSVRSKAKE